MEYLKRCLLTSQTFPISWESGAVKCNPVCGEVSQYQMQSSSALAHPHSCSMKTANCSRKKMQNSRRLKEFEADKTAFWRNLARCIWGWCTGAMESGKKQCWWKDTLEKYTGTMQAIYIQCGSTAVLYAMHCHAVDRSLLQGRLVVIFYIVESIVVSLFYNETAMRLVHCTMCCLSGILV